LISLNPFQSNPAGNSLVYATFLGGSGVDSAFGIAVNEQGNAYVLGITGSSDFPTTPGALDPSYNGGYWTDFVAELNLPALLSIAVTAPPLATTGAPITYTLTVTNATGQTIANLRITDTIPLSASYVSGCTRSGDVVTWAVASLATGISTTVQLVVTASQTITNDTYRATADGNLSAVGEAPAVTFVGQPVTGKPYYYFGSQRVAMRRGGAVYYLHGDHLTRTPRIARIGALAFRVICVIRGVRVSPLNNRQGRRHRGASALLALRPGALDERPGPDRLHLHRAEGRQLHALDRDGRAVV
jgi:uncharacterized repeat protein (TIGR01451 family)